MPTRANCIVAYRAGPARACPAHLIEQQLLIYERARRFGVGGPIAVDVVVGVAQYDPSPSGGIARNR
jgi:hypothetical protein